MLLDDHEIVDNWSREALRTPAGRVRYANAMRAYEAFQRSHGPALPSNRTADAYFEQDGISFFLLDTRTGRRRAGRHGQVMRLRQWKSLYRALRDAQAASPDSPKVICSGSVLAPGLREGRGDISRPAGPGNQPPRSVDTWQHSDRERRLLLAMLSRLRVRHAVLLSSDYHCSAAAEIRLPDGTTAVALCAPPLHAPLVFANAQPGDLLPDETVRLRPGGAAAAIRLALHERGDGWMDCRLVRDAAGWTLEATFRLRDMLGAAPGEFRDHCLRWRLGGPAQPSGPAAGMLAPTETATV
jgi:phosphodiesterase/alkaline phosphatase D-like protein